MASRLDGSNADVQSVGATSRVSFAPRVGNLARVCRSVAREEREGGCIPSHAVSPPAASDAPCVESRPMHAPHGAGLFPPCTEESAPAGDSRVALEAVL